MYTVALAFLIFTGTGFNLQIVGIRNILVWSVGADLQLWSPDIQFPLDEFNFRHYLQQYTKNNPTNLQNYTFASFPLHRFPYIPRTLYSTLSMFPQRRSQILAVEENFLSAVFLDFYTPSEFSE
jgi:hypothetical protein